MKKVITVLVLTSFLSTVALQDVSLALPQKSDKYSLATLPVWTADSDITRTEARVLTSRLTEGISGADLFYTMTQDDVERGLLGGNIDLMGCETADCVIRQGKTLNIQLAVYATISQRTSGYAVQLNMVHIQSRQIVKSLDEFFQGDLNGLISEMFFYGRRLLGLAAKSDRGQADYFLDPGVGQNYGGTGSGFKWYYLGLGVLVAGGIGAAVAFSQGSSDNGEQGPTTPSPATELPGAPSFP